MLICIDTWAEFSNSVAAGENKSCTNSLEAIHNVIHFAVGGEHGHMGQIELAGEYPPIQ